MADSGGTIEIAGKHVKKSTAAIAGVGIVGGAVLYARHRGSQNSSSVATDAGTAASTADPSIDPSTGIPYAQEDSGFGFQDAGLNSSSFTGGEVIGYDGNGNPIYGPGTSGVAIGAPGSFTNNAQWAQAFEQQVGSTGNDPTAAALGKYLTGQTLTSDQVTTVQEAIASQGYPPTAGSGGDPPNFKTAPTANPPVTTTAGTITVPNVVHMKVSAAIAALAKSGLKAGIHQASTSATVVNSQTPGAGAKVTAGATVDLGLS
jgi:hypothetical protein